MRKICIFLMMILCYHFIIGQTPEDNKAKYEHFRQKLTTQFIYYTGDATIQGSHLPLEARYFNRIGQPAAWLADATWWQGHYIAMLATEYALLKREGLNTDKTLAELRCAVATYRRLDLAAERCFGDSTYSVCNGFYLRDDVPTSIAPKLGLTTLWGDYTNNCGKMETRGNAPSQDQAWASYLGFALVQKLVDDDSLRAEIADIAYNMVKIMQYTSPNGRKYWRIVNPVTGATIQPEGDIQWLQYAHAYIGTMLSGKNMYFNNAKSCRGLWKLVQNNILMNTHGHFRWYGVFAMATVMNDAGNGKKSCYEWLIERNEKIVKKRPDLQQTLFFPHLPLINVVLYGQQGELQPAALYENYLNSAPYEGAGVTIVDGASVRSPAPWHSLSLFCPWHTENEGKFNMIDYMLLYNLYQLVYAKQ